MDCPECGVPIVEDPPARSIGMPEQEAELLIFMREEKDQFLKEHPQSPIPEEIREDFKGLDYFPVNPSTRFHCRLNRYPDPEAVRMMTSAGVERDYLKVGYVRFIIDGRVQTLQAYRSAQEDRSEGEGETLFVPFKDATSGKESYGAGRYLEIEENPDGSFLVDFNRAYNPFCAYSERYSCPYPPRENWLDVEVKAGEKKFRDQR